MDTAFRLAALSDLSARVDTMPRPQFSIRSLLWLTLVVGAFLGGMLYERERAARRGNQTGVLLYGVFQKDFVAPASSSAAPISVKLWPNR